MCYDKKKRMRKVKGETKRKTKINLADGLRVPLSIEFAFNRQRKKMGKKGIEKNVSKVQKSQNKGHRSITKLKNSIEMELTLTVIVSCFPAVRTKFPKGSSPRLRLRT